MLSTDTVPMAAAARATPDAPSRCMKRTRPQGARITGIDNAVPRSEVDVTGTPFVPAMRGRKATSRKALMFSSRVTSSSAPPSM